MRTEDQIQRAHDIFAAIVLKDVPSPFGESPETTKLCVATLDALCWCLGHDHGGHTSLVGPSAGGGQGLKTNLQCAETWLARRGYVLGERK